MIKSKALQVYSALVLVGVSLYVSSVDAAGVEAPGPEEIKTAVLTQIPVWKNTSRKTEPPVWCCDLSGTVKKDNADWEVFASLKVEGSHAKPPELTQSNVHVNSVQDRSDLALEWELFNMCGAGFSVDYPLRMDSPIVQSTITAVHSVPTHLVHKYVPVKRDGFIGFETAE